MVSFTDDELDVVRVAAQEQRRILHPPNQRRVARVSARFFRSSGRTAKAFGYLKPATLAGTNLRLGRTGVRGLRRRS
jgi:hypothetical protein